MPSKIILTPAYGQEYRSDSQVEADWEAGKDFREPLSGSYVNKQDAGSIPGLRWVNIRYNNNRKVHVIKMGSAPGLRSNLIRLAASKPAGSPERTALLGVLAGGSLGVVEYKGRKYNLLWKGKTKYGPRAKLQFLNGPKEFWVDLSLITEVDTFRRTGPSRERSRKVQFRFWNGRTEWMSEEEAEMAEDMGQGTT